MHDIRAPVTETPILHFNPLGYWGYLGAICATSNSLDSIALGHWAYRANQRIIGFHCSGPTGPTFGATIANFLWRCSSKRCLQIDHVGPCLIMLDVSGFCWCWFICDMSNFDLFDDLLSIFAYNSIASDHFVWFVLNCLVCIHVWCNFHMFVHVRHSIEFDDMPLTVVYKMITLDDFWNFKYVWGVY